MIGFPLALFRCALSEHIGCHQGSGTHGGCCGSKKRTATYGLLCFCFNQLHDFLSLRSYNRQDLTGTIAESTANPSPGNDISTTPGFVIAHAHDLLLVQALRDAAWSGIFSATITVRRDAGVQSY